jgi:hypothetical protein
MKKPHRLPAGQFLGTFVVRQGTGALRPDGIAEDLTNRNAAPVARGRRREPRRVKRAPYNHRTRSGEASHEAGAVA